MAGMNPLWVATAMVCGGMLLLIVMFSSSTLLTARSPVAERTPFRLSAARDPVAARQSQWLANAGFDLADLQAEGYPVSKLPRRLFPAALLDDPGDSMYPARLTNGQYSRDAREQALFEHLVQDKCKVDWGAAVEHQLAPWLQTGITRRQTQQLSCGKKTIRVSFVRGELRFGYYRWAGMGEKKEKKKGKKDEEREESKKERMKERKKERRGGRTRTNDDE